MTFDPDEILARIDGTAPLIRLPGERRVATHRGPPMLGWLNRDA